MNAEPLIVERVSLPSMGTISRVQSLVANSYGMKVSDLRHDGTRKGKGAWPRQVGIYFCREMFGLPLPKIAKAFCIHHTTAIFAVKAVKERIAADPVYRADVEALREALR